MQASVKKKITPTDSFLNVNTSLTNTPLGPAKGARVEEAKVEEARAEEIKVEEAKVEEAKAEEIKAEETKVEEAKAEEPKAVSPKPAPKRSLIFDLGAEIAASAKGAEVESSDSTARQEDPEAEAKLISAREEIIAQVATQRPRFRATFEGLTIEGHRLLVEVPTPELELELRRSELELLNQIVEIAGVNGYIELAITVNETIRARRPIKLEDKIRHFAELNPEIVELTKALDLQADS